MADADVSDMLKAWGLEYYIDIFEGKYYRYYLRTLA
jgi:hypothetical protein